MEQNLQYETEQQLIERIGMEYFTFPEPPPLFIPPMMLIQWHVTERCNLRCTHCYQSEEMKKQEISFEASLKILNQIIKLLKKWSIWGHFNITGGEPWVQDWFPDFLEKIHENNDVCSFAILSNGTLIKESHAEQLKRLNCDCVQISIDGTQKTHDEIRGLNAFARSVEGIKLLRKYGISTMLSFTAHKQNHQDFCDVAEFARNLGVDWVWSDRVLPVGRGEQLSEQMMQPQEVEAFFETMYGKMTKLKKKWFCRTEVRMHRALQFLTRHKHGEKEFPIYQCGAGSRLVTILPNGDVLPCRRMPIVVGSLLEQDIENIYNNSLLFQRLRDRRFVAKGCEACDFRHACNGGLRCLSYAYYKNPFIADPQCFKIHSQLPPADAK